MVICQNKENQYRRIKITIALQKATFRILSAIENEDNLKEQQGCFSC
jgi:hypothetical protein